MYTLTQSGVLRKDGQVVPLDDSTPEYQAYIVWLAAGNGPDIVDDGSVYPRIVVTAWQLIQALQQNGLLDAVESATSTSEDVLVRMGWQRAPYFYSDESFVVDIANKMGISRDSLQNLFKFAATL